MVLNLFNYLVLYLRIKSLKRIVNILFKVGAKRTLNVSADLAEGCSSAKKPKKHRTMVKLLESRYRPVCGVKSSPDHWARHCITLHKDFISNDDIILSEDMV